METETETEETNQILEAIEYITLDFTKGISIVQLQPLQQFYSDLVLKIQGESIEIPEENNILILMKVLDIAHQFCPELVLKLKTGKKILIYEHQGRKVIRPNDVSIDFINYNNEKIKFEAQEYVEEQVIDIEKYSNEEKDIKSCFKKIIKNIKPSSITFLMGEKSPLLFLLVQHYLYGITGEIWYQKNSDAESIKITKT